MPNLAARKNGIGVKMAAKTVASHRQVAGVPRPGGSKGVTVVPSGLPPWGPPLDRGEFLLKFEMWHFFAKLHH